MKKLVEQFKLSLQKNNITTRLKHLRGRHDQLDHAWNRGMGRGGGGAALAPNQMGPIVSQDFYRKRKVELMDQRRQGTITRAEMRRQLDELRGITRDENNPVMPIAQPVAQSVVQQNAEPVAQAPDRSPSLAVAETIFSTSEYATESPVILQKIKDARNEIYGLQDQIAFEVLSFVRSLKSLEPYINRLRINEIVSEKHTAPVSDEFRALRADMTQFLKWVSDPKNAELIGLDEQYLEQIANFLANEDAHILGSHWVNAFNIYTAYKDKIMQIDGRLLSTMPNLKIFDDSNFRDSYSKALNDRTEIMTKVSDFSSYVQSKSTEIEGHLSDLSALLKNDSTDTQALYSAQQRALIDRVFNDLINELSGTYYSQSGKYEEAYQSYKNIDQQTRAFESESVGRLEKLKEEINDAREKRAQLKEAITNRVNQGLPAFDLISEHDQYTDQIKYLENTMNRIMLDLGQLYEAHAAAYEHLKGVILSIAYGESPGDVFPEELKPLVTQLDVFSQANSYVGYEQYKNMPAHRFSVDFLNALAHRNPQGVGGVKKPSDTVPMSEKKEQEILEAMSAVLSMFPRNGDLLPTINFEQNTVNRAFHDPNRRAISLSADTPTSTVIHEAMHAMQQVYPKLFDLVWSFVKRRIGNETPIRLNEYHPNSRYKDDEISFLDSTDETYTFKMYETGPFDPTTVQSAGDQDVQIYGKKAFAEVHAMAFTRLFDQSSKKDKELFSAVLTSIMLLPEFYMDEGGNMKDEETYASRALHNFLVAMFDNGNIGL